MLNKIWKTIVATLSLCITITGCNANIGSETRTVNIKGQSQEKVLDEKNVAAYTKDDLKSSFSATIDESTIIDEDEIKVIAKSLIYSSYSVELELELINNTSTDCTFRSGTMGYSYNSINGFSVAGGYFAQDVAAGRSETVTAQFSLDDLILLGFTDIAVIGVGIQVEDSSGIYYESGEVEIKTSAFDSYDLSINSFISAMDGDILSEVYDFTISKSEKEVYINGNISIESIYVLTSNEGKQAVFIQAYNSGSDKAFVNTRDIYVNGEEVYEGIWSSEGLLPGKRGVLTIDLSRVIDDYENSDLAKNGADSIDFTFRLNSARGEEIWSDKISIQIK